MLTKIGAVVFVAVVVAGCQAFRKSYDEAFIKSWKKGFIESCAGKDGPAEKRALCICLADKAVEELSVKELSDISYAIKYIKEKLLFVCMEQVTGIPQPVAQPAEPTAWQEDPPTTPEPPPPTEPAYNPPEPPPTDEGSRESSSSDYERPFSEERE